MGQVSFTLDMWLGQNSQNYLAITAHWIAELEGTISLQLKAALIAFHYLCEGHTGKSMVQTVMHLLDRVRVMVNVRHIHCSSH